MSLRHQLRLVACAVQLLTRLPTPRLEPFDPDWTTRAARYYPLVGQLIGALCAAAFWMGSTAWGGVIPALLAVALGAWITGGFHEDGLADAFDGLGGGRTREERLAIMKDSRIGSYGALALGLVTALRVAALSRLPVLQGALALVAVHGAARAMAVAVMAALPYARLAGDAKLPAATRPVGWGEAAFALAWGLWPLAMLGSGLALAGLALAALTTLALARTAQRRLNGYTGDVLGAVEQLAEAALLLGLASGYSR